MEDRGGQIGNIIKIIWAPTHAIAKEQLGTFKYNYKIFLELAKKYKETTSWVFRPHQNLAISSVEEGVFSSTDEYFEYVKKWDSLPNARSSIAESHVDIMKTSDCLFLDSITFITEYIYLDKPIIFLSGPVKPFNEYADEIMKATYRVNGKHTNEIEEALKTIVLERQDTFREKRHEVFEKHFNYLRYNQSSASEFIINDIKESLWKKQ